MRISLELFLNILADPTPKAVQTKLLKNRELFKNKKERGKCFDQNYPGNKQLCQMS